MPNSFTRPKYDLRQSRPRTLFLTDNGRCLCGQHLGASARFTGRDISGQRILALAPADMAAIRQEFGPDYLPSCEECGLSLMDAE